MVQYSSDNSVRGQPAKPMKIQFMAPEMEIVNGTFTDFDVEKASVYMVGAVIVYVLFGQFVPLNRLSRNSRNQQSNGWTLDMLPSHWKWLYYTVHPNPFHRKSLKWIKHELERMLSLYFPPLCMNEVNRVHDPQLMTMRYFEREHNTLIRCHPGDHPDMMMDQNNMNRFNPHNMNMNVNGILMDQTIHGMM